MKANETKTSMNNLKQEKEEEKKAEENEVDEYRVGRHMPQKVMQISGVRSGWRCKICRRMSSTKA